MILQALYDLAAREDLMSDPDYQWKPIAWLVRVDKDGSLLGISGTHYTPPTTGRKKAKPVAKDMRVPYQPGRTGSRAPAQFFVDNAKFVFGLPTKDKTFSDEEGREKAADFREKVRECARATNDEGAQAVLDFLENVASGKEKVTLAEECVSNEQFAFVYAPDVDRLVHERPAVKEYWKQVRAQSGEASASTFHCLVSGEPVIEPGLFPQIKKAPGGSTSGVGFVSFNKNAFESYGLKGNENAPVARFAAEACATALNRLLDPAFPDPNHPGEKLPSRNYRLSADTVVCFWAVTDSAQDFCNQFAPILEANPDDVRQTYHSIWRGKTPPDLDPSDFYALTLSGTQGRAIVRDWFESTVSDVATHLARYFADLDIVRNTPRPKDRKLPPQLPLTILLRSLAPQGALEGIPAHVAAQMARAALSAKRYPLTVFHRALERMRAEIGDDDWRGLERRDARAALIKAILIRNYERKVKRDMDSNNTEPGYVLGRLLAVIERAQQVALGDVNATVIDRFFSGASATPGSVYPRLLKNMRHHISKAKDSDRGGVAVWLDRQADDILAGVDGFPAYLPLEQQGLFVLGYHHQRHALWQKKEAKPNRSDEEKN